jgi:hypothetical protein
MSHPTQVTKHDETVVGFMLGAVLVFCLLTLVLLMGVI